jgi:hypothetical protein
LVASGQLSREAALLDLEGIPYPSEQELQADIKFFLKKMGWDQSKLDDYLSRPEIKHSKYGSDITRAFILPIIGIVGKLQSLLRLRRR